jgi:hypothetical protein
MRERAAGLKVGSRALAAKDLRALEGGPGRRRAGEEAASVAEQNLGVGTADVGYQHQFVAQIGCLGECGAGRVGTDIAGDARQAQTWAPGAIARPHALACVSQPLSIVSANGATPSSVGSRPRNK